MDEPTAAVKTLGRYQLHGELGRGAMGVVYRAFDPVIGRTVALKTLTIEGKDQEAETLRQRLYREACAAGTLAHTNIVTIYDVIEHGGTTAVAMEFIEGQTLADLIDARAPMPLDAALDIFEQICSAIDYAGSQGIVHRDIKPANIIITSDGRVKVADFGVARIEASTMTQTGMVMGSPSYMSPEQVRGLPLDARSDLFSAAVVLYELLTKERPFAGDDVATTMYRIVHEPPTPPSQFNVAIGDGVTAILQRAMAKTADERYRTGAEVCAQLRRSLSGADLPVLPTLPPQAATARFSPLVLGVAGVGVVVLLVLIIVAMSGGAEAPETPVQQAVASPAPVSVPVAPMLVAEPEPPVAEVPVSMPVTTIPPRSGSPVAASAPVAPVAPVAPETAAPAPAPEPEAAAPAVPLATLTVAYAGPPYAVAISAGGDRLGVVSGNGGGVSVEPGTHRIRASSSAVFLSEDLGTMTFESGAEQTIRMPALASAFVGVLGDAYDGLEITISGSRVDGPYPAQLARMSVGRHAVSFRWTTGGLSGLEINDVIDVPATGHYLIRAVPQTSQVTVQKLR